jgi:hypothetical protein
MNITIDHVDALALVIGTKGPNSYVHPFKDYGDISGFPNESWKWDNSKLKSMCIKELYALYLEIKTFNQINK